MIFFVFVAFGQIKKTPTSYKAPTTQINSLTKTTETDKMLNTKSISKNSSLSYNKSFREKETMVVYVIDNKTEKLSNIVLYEAFKNDYRETKLKKYKNRSFLTGYVKGDYQEKGGEVVATKGSSLIIIKDKNASLFDKPAPVFIDIPKKERYTGRFEFIPGKEFSPGNQFGILFNRGYGRPYYEPRSKVEVIKNDKNQAVLRVLSVTSKSSNMESANNNINRSYNTPSKPSYSYKKNYKNSKQVEMVFVIDNNTQKLTNVVLYDSFTNLKRETVFKKYKKSSFLTGSLKGKYQIKDGEVIAEKGSSYIIIKDKNASLFDKTTPVFTEIPKKEQYTGKFEFLHSKKFLRGEMFIILFDSKVGYGRPPMPYWNQLNVEIIKNDKNQTILKVL